MSLFTTLNVGASGLGVASTSLGVAGDNIANVNSTGFKETRATFADFLPQDVFGLAKNGQMGTGAAPNYVSTLFGQGILEATDSSLDMAITGAGFFVVNDGPDSYYTRNGEFYLDNEGFIVSASGLRLQGHNADNGTLSAAIDDLRVNNATLPGVATSTITLEAQLSADTVAGADLAVLDFFGTGAGTNTLIEAGDAADFSTSTTVYDSLGLGHEVTILFERVNNTDWTWRSLVDATEAFDPAGVAFSATAGDAFEIATGTVTFDTAGELTAFTQTDTAGWTFQAAAPPAVVFDFGIDIAGVATDGALIMGGSESSVSAIGQDGRSTGNLSSVAIGDNGILIASYTNGEDLTIGQVLLATFKSESGLIRAGGTLFEKSIASGEPAVDVAGTDGRGDIVGNALEKSNVDLEDQFINMITAQRSYQASAKVVTTADESLQALLNMV